MKKAKNHSSPTAWVLRQTNKHKKQYIFSVILAIIGVVFSIAPYFVVAKIVYGLMNENRNLYFYLIACLIMAIFWIGRVLFHALALVGPSGSGKSTIARLIATLWDVNKGKITLGNKDIRDIPLQDYVDKIAFVSQDNFLFNMTVRENIRLGCPNESDEEIEQVAKQSGCHDFISSLPNGYDTIIGEGGASLSGGERQRITIARAMLKKAPIVILDEATANIDPENENDLMRAIQQLTNEKTVIMIAHRLKTVKNADQILVVDQGKIVQRGKHAELMKEDGIYRKLINDRNEATNWEITK